MTKVEELQEMILRVNDSETIAELTDDLIFFAWAEGAEQEREMIRKTADEWAERYKYTPMRGTSIVPEYILSPTPKEKK